MHSEEYVVARRVLLDALGALSGHLESIILVGAQAVYLHTGAADLAVAESTTDADLAIDPRVLGAHPEIASVMRRAGFERDRRGGEELVGIWASPREIGGVSTSVCVDLLVPEELGGRGRRGARVKPHEQGSMLKVRGISAALVDNTKMPIAALEDGDSRVYALRVAGPAALLIAKTIKLSERLDVPVIGRRSRLNRIKPKDALDVLRLVRAVPTQRFVADMSVLMEDEVAGVVTQEAILAMRTLFGSPSSPGSLLAAEAAAPEPADIISASVAALCGQILDGLVRA